jgi:sodium transport system ATP-binding protein
LETITFETPAAAVTGLLGPNGAGKTTLLRLLAGLLRPDAGTIWLAGHDVARQPLARRQLGVLTEAAGLYSRLTTREHLRYAGQLHGLGGAGLDARINELLALLDLEALADVRTAGFSRGEQARVSLARTLLHQPRVLLLDEPTSTLDVASARVVRGVVRDLREQGASVLLASHVMSEVEQLCDRLVLLASGRVVAVGTVNELRAATGQGSLEDAFVAATSRPIPGLAPRGVSWGRPHDAPSEPKPAADRCHPWAADPRATLREASVVLRKELIDYWRDGGSQLTRLVLVLVGVCAILFPLATQPREVLKAFFEPVRLGVVGAEYAPALVAALGDRQVIVESGPADPLGAVRSGATEVVLVVPAEYEEALAAGRPPELRLIASTARPASDRARQYIDGVLARYGARLAEERLLMRGVDPALETPFQVALEDVAERVGPGGIERDIVVVVLGFSIMNLGLTGGSLASQVTAGERERHTLEPLLQATVQRLGLVLGKSGAALVFGLLASVPVLLASAAAGFLPYVSLLGVPSVGSVASGVFGLVLLALVVVPLQMALVCAFPGSADAASGRLMVVTLPLTGLAVLAAASAPFGVVPHAIPLFGAVVVMVELVLGVPVPPLALTMALVGSLGTTALLLGLVARLYEREAIIRA